MSALLIRTVAARDPEGNNEALPSWLLRLAHDNGYRTFGALFSGERLKVPRQRSLEVLDAGAALEGIARLTLVKAESIEALTLREALSVVTGAPEGAGGVQRSRGRWLLKAPPGVKGARYSVCCACLADDPKPFVRTHWRLSNVCWCAVHETGLIDECPTCGAPLILAESRTAKLSVCSACGHDLTSDVNTRTGLVQARWLTTNPIHLVHKDLPVQVALPHLWWDGVRVLLELASRPALAAKLLKADLPPASHAALLHIASRERTDFDKEPAAIRRGLLMFVDRLTQDWPRRFVELMGEAGITHTHFGSTELAMPYWLYATCREKLLRKQYATTADESRAAIALLRRDRAVVSKRAVKALLGVTESKALDLSVLPIQKALSMHQLAAAIQYLAAEVRTTEPSRDQQAGALRDACCIATAAWLGVGFERAALLGIDTGQQLLKNWKQRRAPSDERDVVVAQFAEWMELYLNGVRPRFQRGTAFRDSLFLTRFGEPYKGFGVAAPFSRSLRHTGVADWRRGARLLVGSALPFALGNEESRTKR